MKHDHETDVRDLSTKVPTGPSLDVQGRGGDIRPYPNPWSYGGMFGFGSAKGEDDLAKAIKTFEEYAEGFKGKGLVKIEVVRHDQKTVTTQRKLSQPEKQEPKSETKQLSLI